MRYQESETVELKERFVKDILKEIIAFANTGGGTIYIGINDAGMPIGVEEPDKVIQQITNAARDSIKPDIMLFLNYDIQEIEGKAIVVIEVQQGTIRPYYLASKGIRPEGVFVRQGTSAVSASDIAIRQMLLATERSFFEDMVSLEQNLSFQTAQNEFAKRHLPFEKSQMKTLGLLNISEQYTNLALLLSDQCKHTIKVAVFEGDDSTVFKDRREFSGSLLQQLNDAYDYIDLHNHTYATFDKLLRIDEQDYPKVAIREALLNALVHRDYAFSASVSVNIYADRLEFVSIGGLVPGIALEDVFLGLSLCRNAKLANIFYRLQLIEAYGTGLRKIMGAYKDTLKKPTIETTNHAFKVTLPNLHANNSDQLIEPNEEKILAFLSSHDYITRKDVESLLNVSQPSATRIINKMIDKQLLRKEQTGKNTRYIK